MISTAPLFAFVFDDVYVSDPMSRHGLENEDMPAVGSSVAAWRHPLTMSCVLALPWPTSEHFRSGSLVGAGSRRVGDIM